MPCLPGVGAVWGPKAPKLLCARNRGEDAGPTRLSFLPPDWVSSRHLPTLRLPQPRKSGGEGEFLLWARNPKGRNQHGHLVGAQGMAGAGDCHRLLHPVPCGAGYSVALLPSSMARKDFCPHTPPPACWLMPNYTPITAPSPFPLQHPKSFLVLRELQRLQ